MVSQIFHFSNLTLSFLEKYDHQFDEFVDCESDELVEDKGRYQIQVEFFEEIEISQIPMEVDKVLSTTTSSVHSNPNPLPTVQYPDLKEKVAKYVCVPKYQPM